MPCCMAWSAVEGGWEDKVLLIVAMIDPGPLEGVDCTCTCS